MNKVGFLLDMDGVIYRGSKLIPGAAAFIGFLVVDHVGLIPDEFIFENLAILAQ